MITAGWRTATTRGPGVERCAERHARAVLDNLPSVKDIRARLTELEMAASVDYFALVRRDDVLFALKFQPPKQQPLLVVLKSADDSRSERVLIDPGELDSTGATTIDWYVPSLDGKRVAVSLSSAAPSRDGPRLRRDDP